MFGVLVLDDGAVLHAFSGDASLDGDWAPHVYDREARAAIEPEADRLVKSLDARLPSLAEHDAAVARLAVERDALREQHRLRRAARHAGARNDDESRADKRERRDFEARAEAELAAFAPLVRRRAAVERLRRIVSREAMRRIHDTYVLENALGERVRLRELFESGEPPWGAAECAAVKLLQHAIRLKKTPVALAEVWWGPPPAGGGRVAGAFYPACKPKCGPVLPFLLRGLDVAPRRAFRSSPRPFTTLHEDASLVVVAKPEGLLSVPGKEETDSVLTRLRERHPGAMLVHRLDLDTSGVLLAARDFETYRALQARWHAVEKRYIAWLDGDVRGEHGTLSLPLRVDLEQRPRQLVDFVHGRHAVTDWRVLSRKNGRTRVAFFPRTGRTHQLRVHAAHRDGLGCPIVGDRLYGAEAGRLMLHAEALTFTHPASGARVTFEVAAPF
ncbi:MAG: RluA family pseudouridine synthase [Myxococcaceae bacterium]|nr:RluA family pseudouridine synthase [Myxococcaceae bacterium]